MPCCAVKLCSLCLLTHTITNINNGKTKIECPSCSQHIDSTTILYNTELPASIRERYQQALARDLFSEQKNIFIKLCPHCTYITILDENDPHIHERKSHRSIRPFLTCEHCGREWCWSCYSPAHPNRTCRQIRRNRSQLDTWAKIRRVDKNNQRNAQHSNFYSIPLFFFFELQVQTTFSGLLAIRLSTMFSSQNIYQQINTMAIVFDVSFQFLHSITQSKSQSIVQFQNVSSRVLLTLQPVTKLHFTPTSFEPLVNPQVFLKIEKMFSVFFCVPIIQTSNRPNINGKMPPKKLLLMTH